MSANRTASILLACSLAIAGGATARAENVDLSTIPERDTVQLTIYNSEDLTLVRESRHVTFRRGINPLQFSWANTLIDPTSVDLRFRTHADKLNVLDTTFPHAKPQMLYWNVQSEVDGDAVVEISYFTSGITWAADYVCTSDPAEEQMTFEGFVKITNNSGENYADAQVRLVVGEINLVERVAELARRGLISSDDEKEYYQRQRKAARFNEPAARMALEGAVAGSMDRAAAAPKEIIKEGLSEYFLYTIEGTETIPHGWSKRMRLFEGGEVPFEIAYRYRPAEYGEQLVRLFILRNDEASELGTTPLPDGTVRLFRENGRDGLSFLTAYHTKYVPIGQEIELNLGLDPEVIHERIRLQSWRDSFWFKDVRGRKVFSPTQGQQVRHDYPVVGWDDNDRWVDRIRNYRDKPIDVEIRLTLYGHILFSSNLDPVLHDFQSPQFTARIKPGQTRDLAYTVTARQGINQKQNNVALRRVN
ncbi:MAG: DUF4139 domain-containing protein [Planctomycetota bacterium]|jgi:hypothetical protein